MNVAFGFATAKKADLGKCHLDIIDLPSGITNPPQFAVSLPIPIGTGLTGSGNAGPNNCVEGDIVRLILTDGGGTEYEYVYNALVLADLRNHNFSIDIGSDTYTAGNATAKARFERGSTVGAWSSTVSFVLPSASASVPHPARCAAGVGGNTNAGFCRYINLWRGEYSALTFVRDGIVNGIANITGATYDHTGNAEGERHLSQGGRFSDYSFTAGDMIYLVGTGGVATGLYEVASKVDNDAILLAADAGLTGDSTGNDIVATSEAYLFGASLVDSNFELIASISGAQYIEARIFSGTDDQFQHLGTSDAEPTNREYTIGWTGDAVIDVEVRLSAAAVENIDLINHTATWAPATGEMGGILKYTLDDSGGDMPTGIFLVETSKLSLHQAGQVFDSDTMDYYSQFACSRFLSIQNTNLDNDIVTDFAHLPTDSVTRWGALSNDNGRKYGGASATSLAEWANYTLKPIWVCIPTAFTDSAVSSLLTVLRDNINFSSIPGVPLYLEFSNECPWNYHSSYCVAQAAAYGAPLTTGSRWYGFRAAAMADIARTVFGEDSGDDRFAFTLGAQTNSSSAFSNALVGAQEYIDSFGESGLTISQLFSHCGITTYWSLVTDNDQPFYHDYMLNPIQEVFTEFWDAIMSDEDEYSFGGVDFFNPARLLETIGGHKTIAEANGLDVIPYEGGYHGIHNNPWRDANHNKGTATRDARESYRANDRIYRYIREEIGAQTQYDIMDFWQANFNPNNNFNMQFLGHDRNGRFGNWGLINTFSPIDINERANAVMAWNFGAPYYPNYRPMLMKLTAS